MPTFSSVQAQENKFAVTTEELAACQDDVVRLCSDAYPDQERILLCMRAKRSQLGAVCQKTFTAGLQTRHMAQ